MGAYLFELSIYWSAFYLLYLVLLRQQTFFRLNRFYLLVALVAGSILPLIGIPAVSVGAGGLPAVWLPVAEVGTVIERAVPGAAAAGGSWSGWILIWVAGGVLAAARLLYGLWQISVLLENSRQEYKPDYVLVHTDRVHLPFSFGRYLFWSSRFEMESGEARQILRHEATHIRQRHTLDVLILEIAGILLWWHPLVYGFRHALRQVHEFLADASVLEVTTRKQYGTLLLLQLQPGLRPALANHFFQSQLKSRIRMMTRPPSRRQAALRYLLTLPLLGGLLLACNLEKMEELSAVDKGVPAGDSGGLLTYTQRDTIITINPDTYEESVQVVSQDVAVFKVVEEMPRFPGCDERESALPEKEQCAQMELLNFISSNIRYPEAARDAGIEGTVVVRFVVAANGQVMDPVILRGIGSGCDEEVLRIVGEMPRWIPGRQRGKEVAVQFNLPVRFQLAE